MILLRDSSPFRHCPEPDIAAAAAQVHGARLRAIVEALAFPRNFILEREANRRAGQWLFEQLAACGLATSWQGRYENVVARTEACARSRSCLLVGAHYDSKPGSPGADDNASAVAAMLVCAEIIARRFSDLPVCFVGFNCEEEERLGSLDFVAEARRGNDPQVRLAHILEMVGYIDEGERRQRIPFYLPIRVPERGNFLGLIANQRSIPAARRVMSYGGAYQDDLPVLSLLVYLGLEKVIPVLRRSDHASFWQRRIPALMWTDTSEFRNPHYHLSTDTPDTLDYEFLARVTRLLVVSVLNDGRSLLH
jgi:hypothetical protein